MLSGQSGTVRLRVAAAGAHSELAAPDTRSSGIDAPGFYPQPTGDFHVLFCGELCVDNAPLHEEPYAEGDFREHLDKKPAQISFESKPMPRSWAELNNGMIGYVRSDNDLIDGKIFSDQATLAYIANIATALPKEYVSEVNFSLELMALKPELQLTEMYYAALRVNLGITMGDVPWELYA
jgi:hypothetical protein